MSHRRIELQIAIRIIDRNILDRVVGPRILYQGTIAPKIQLAIQTGPDRQSTFAVCDRLIVIPAARQFTPKDARGRDWIRFENESETRHAL